MRWTIALLAGGLWVGSAACAASVPTVDVRHVHAFGGVLRAPLTTVREDVLVPQAHSGPGFDLGLRYAAAVGDGVLRVDLGFGARYVMGQYGARGLDIQHGLRVRHAFTLAEGEWGFGLGPAFGWESDIAYLETWDDAHAYWATDRWLGLTATAWTRLSACWRIDLAGELMLLGVQSRPSGKPEHKQDELDAFVFYLRAPQRNARFAWLGDTQRLRLGFELWRSRSRSAVPAGWGFGAEARAVRAAWPESWVLLEVALTVSGTWGWP